MHFSNTEYSYNYPHPTLAVLNPSVTELGNSYYPTILDYLQINFLYCGGMEIVEFYEHIISTLKLNIGLDNYIKLVCLSIV